MGCGSSRQLSSLILDFGIFPSMTNSQTVNICIFFPVVVTVEVNIKKVYYCPTGPLFGALNPSGVVFYRRLKTQGAFFTCSDGLMLCKKRMKSVYPTGRNSRE